MTSGSKLIRDAEMIVAVVVKVCQWVAGSVCEGREETALEKSGPITVRPKCSGAVYHLPTNKERKVAHFQSHCVTFSNFA